MIKISLHRLLGATLGLTVLTALFPAMATAGCGGTPSFQVGPAPNLDQLMDPQSSSNSIVGMWKVIFTTNVSGTVPDATIPPNTMVEFGYAHWHRDGTEFYNSGSRPPNTQNFCMGVWDETGPGTYMLNHFAYNYDPVTSALVGKVNIRENVILEKKGQKFTGTFTIDGWDSTGNQIIKLAGTLQAVRVTVNTVDTLTP